MAVMPKVKCDMCGKVIEFEIKELGRKVFCLRCYYIAVSRLNIFIDKLTLPEEEFEKWLKDDSSS